MHHLLREVLRNGESDHVRGSSCVGVDPAHLSAGETAGLCPSPSTISSLWMVSTVEMDCHPSAACRGQPAHQWLTGLTEVTRGEGTDPHFATSATRSGTTMAGSRDNTSGSPWPISAATAIA